MGTESHLHWPPAKLHMLQTIFLLLFITMQTLREIFLHCFSDWIIKIPHSLWLHTYLLSAYYSFFGGNIFPVSVSLLLSSLSFETKEGKTKKKRVKYLRNKDTNRQCVWVCEECVHFYRNSWASIWCIPDVELSIMLIWRRPDRTSGRFCEPKEWCSKHQSGESQKKKKPRTISCT